MLNKILENLLVLQRIHRTPKALMPEGQELVVIDQPLEGLLNEFFAVAQIVKDLRAKDEAAAVDPKIGVSASARMPLTLPS